MVETWLECWVVDLGASGIDEFEYIDIRLAMIDALTETNGSQIRNRPSNCRHRTQRN